MYQPIIPLHWDVTQAIEVTDFLAEIIVWDTHGARMSQYLRIQAAEEAKRQAESKEDNDATDHEFPF
ncbi:MAG: hypothetical protein GXP47_12280 [Acidobacteria bacterium]|nr:hypothetical protein [Acidobacteriota bacterium]